MYKLMGILSSAAGGAVIGAMVGPVGIAVGLAFGAASGLIIGLVIAGEDQRRDHRTRELDEIIGTTTGDMGAGPVSLYSTDARREREEHQRWADEWLTPPPPAIS
jgi:hypothetical protein